jgi:streptogramin lyase
VPTAYGIGIDKEGTVWFSQMTKEGTIGKVDPKTLKVTKYIPPFRDRTRRMQISDNGTIWFAVYDDSRIGKFDPKSETFKDYALPNKQTKPYALGLATDGQVWYSSYYRDVMGKLDPDTGKVLEYPMPYVDNGMRDSSSTRTARCGLRRRRTTRSATSMSPTGSAAPRRAERMR